MTRCCLVHLGGCNGYADPHHVLKQQHIRTRFRFGGVWHDGKLVPLGRTALVSPEVTLRELLDDRRNIVALCRRHHDLHHGASSVHLEPPESAWEFAVELGLSSVFEKSRDRRAA